MAMSTWTLAEVKRLRTSEKGGNAWGRARWFAKMTPEDEKALIPNESDTLPKYKELVYCVYERKAFYDPNAMLPANSTGTAKPVNPHKPTVKHAAVATKPSGGNLKSPTRSRGAPRSVKAETPKVKVEEPEVDLLSFESPGATSTSPDLLAPPGGFQRSLPTSAAVLKPAPVASVNSGEFDPFAVLDQQKKTPSKATTQKQFINAMASATGDPFAALHMNQKRVPAQVQTLPLSMPQPGLQQPPQHAHFGMQPQPQIQRHPMMMPQQVQPPRFPGHQQPNGVHPQQVSMPYATKRAANDDPFAGLQ